MNGEVVNSRIKATEDTTLAKLRPIDQIKMLMHFFANDDVAELDAAQKLSKHEMTMRASLQRLILTAAKGLDNGGHEKVVLSVSSKYIPYLDVVIDKTHGLGRFYRFEVYKQDLSITIEYMFILKIMRKVS